MTPPPTTTTTTTISEHTQPPHHPQMSSNYDDCLQVSVPLPLVKTETILLLIAVAMAFAVPASVSRFVITKVNRSSSGSCRAHAATATTTWRRLSVPCAWLALIFWPSFRAKRHLYFVQYCFTFTHLDRSTAPELCWFNRSFSVVIRPQKPYGVLGTGSPGRPPRLSHSS